jgi:hypothetical protein
MTIPLRATTDVDALDTDALLRLFGTLDCPSVAEMNGDYRARMLRQPAWLLAMAGAVTLGNPATRWMSKGFRPVDDEFGRGYNSFRVLGRTVQRFPMRTRIANSRFDGRPMYELEYAAYRSLCATMNMVDEIRRIDDGRYLGIGTWGYTEAARRVPQPFLLVGPSEPYLGDIG